MFRLDGSLNSNYNSSKRTGTIAQIFEDHWNNIPFEDMPNLLFKAVNLTIYSILNDSYKYLPKIYKKVKKIGKSFNCLKTRLFKKYNKGFYVYAEPKKFPNFKAGVEYITRYCGRCAINENRILNYDSKNVTFCYNDHKDGEND